MWQAETFDPARIDREFALAQGIGMNTMRVFLHDQLWQQDPEGFKKRIDTFLTIAAGHGIKPLFVLFDSCWDPNYKLGPQRPPIPGVHNSGWVQGPGAKALADPAQYPRLEAYVKGVVGAFAKDDRILGWDVWNEPDNNNGNSYPDNSQARFDQVALLLPQVFAWARSADPTQPLTSGVWHHDHWEKLDGLNSVEKTQLTQSDVISFHDYGDPNSMNGRIAQLKTFNRPLLCTEFMARGNGSTFEAILPILKKEKVAAFCWGLVDGKSNTKYPWTTWQEPIIGDPSPWHHDIFRPDGAPYDEDEVALIKDLTGVAASH